MKKTSIAVAKLVSILELTKGSRLNDPYGPLRNDATFTGECSYDNLNNSLGGRLMNILQVDNRATAEIIVNNACASAKQENDHENEGAYAFSDITGEGWQFDANFFDGGTYLNEQYEPVKVPEYFEEKYKFISQSHLITFPSDHLENHFGGCQAQSIMCCWVQDRFDDGNGDGNCDDNNPDVNCMDADPADNTDICYVDLSPSSRSNYVEGGFAIYRDEDTEGDSHCHGMVWDIDDDLISSRYKGNLLFYISMYDHLEARGYVREIPGAPMCSCVERMPTVSRADCTEMDITETYQFTFSKTKPSSDVKVEARIIDIDIEFKACDDGNGNDNDLRAKFDSIDTTSTAKDLFDRHVVGECDNDVFDNFLNTKGYRLA